MNTNWIRKLASRAALPAAGLAVLLSSAPAHAGLEGLEADITNIFRGEVFAGPTRVVVGPGTEAEGFGFLWDIDIGPDFITLTCSSSACNEAIPGAPDEYLFEFLPSPANPVRILRAGVDLTGTAGAYTPVALTFTPSSVKLGFLGTDAAPWYHAALGDTIRIDLGVSPVPEPAAGVLLATGLGALGLVARRRTRREVRVRSAR